MSWFFEKWQVESEFSGRISCSRFLGSWEIWAGNCYQTADYTLKMWRRVMKKVPPQNFKNVLVLGLGAGGNIPQLYKKNSNCQITTVEIDPAMVEIARRTFLKSIKRQPRIIIDDAFKSLANFQEKFDVIIIDLFIGQKPAPAVVMDLFLARLQFLLKPDGYLLLNAYGHPEILDVYKNFFSLHNKIKYLYNTLAIFRHFGLGNIGDPLPADYVQQKSSKDYWLRECQHSSRHFVGTDKCPGIAWHHGPFYFESYQSDVEPEIQPFDHRRYIIWQPLTRLDKPKGWRRSWMNINPRQTGYAPIGPADSYWKIWNSNAQRQRVKSLKNNDYEIFEGTAEEFIPAFKNVKNINFFGIKTLYIELLRKEVKRHGNLIHCYLARHKATNKILAGLVVLDLPEIKQSHHLIAFLYKEAEGEGVGTGLIDYWYQHSISQGFKYHDYGLFWAPGDDRSWKGFTRYKGQFGTRYIRYQKPLVKWVWKSK